MERISRYNLRINTGKGLLAQPSIKLRGHLVDGNGIKVDPKNISRMIIAPRPASKTYLRNIIHLFSYYRQFIQGFTKIDAALNTVKSKHR